MKQTRGKRLLQLRAPIGNGLVATGLTCGVLVRTPLKDTGLGWLIASLVGLAVVVASWRLLRIWADYLPRHKPKERRPAEPLKDGQVQVLWWTFGGKTKDGESSR